jgi:hypothetical protein
MALTVDQVIATYIKLRNKKLALQAEVKEKTDAITEQMQKLESWIKEKADEDGVTSFKTTHGTAFLTTTDFANVADWDAVVEFVKQNDAWDMFEKRISKTAVRGYIDINKEVPAGVNYGTRLDVNIRKPTKKVEGDE